MARVSRLLNLIVLVITATQVYAVDQADYDAIRNRDSTTTTNPPNYAWPTGTVTTPNYNFQFRTPGDPTLTQQYQDNVNTPADTSASSTAVGNQTQSKLGTPAKLKDNLYRPIEGGGTMSTMNGATNFNAQLSCPQSTPFLDIFAMPANTAYGDLDSVTILQNTDMQGPAENTVTLQNVSGVCANGFISCDPGTWNNCVGLKWLVGPAPDFTFTYTPSDIQNLVACTCINNSCGNMLVYNNMNTVLDMIGSGVANEIMKANPEAMLSNVVYNDLQIQIFGQKVSNCVALQSNPSSQNAAYADDLGSMATNAQAEMQNNHLYQLVQNSPIATQTASTQAQCILNHDFNVIQEVRGEIMNHITLGSNSLTRHYCCSGGTAGDYGNLKGSVGSYPGYISASLTSPNFGQARLQTSVSRITWWSTQRSVINFVIDDLFYIDTAIAQASGLDDHINIYINGVRAFSRSGCTTSHQAGWIRVNNSSCPTQCNDNDGNVISCDWADYIWREGWSGSSTECTPATSFNPNSSMNGYPPENGCRGNANPAVDITSLLIQGNNQLVIETFTADQGQSTVTLLFNEAETCTRSEWLDGSCDHLTSRPECRLQTEDQDGIKTYLDFIPTGLVPLPSTRVKTTPRCTYELTQPWWTTTQTYLCTTNPDLQYNFDNALRREASIRDSSQASGFTGYTDLVPGEGGVMTAIDHNFTNRIDPNAATAELVCQTELRTADDQVSVNGVTSEFRDPTSGERIIRIYRPCANNVCPIEPGETMISDCSVMQDFARVLTDTQLIRLGGKDMTCSSGNVIQPPVTTPPAQP